MNGTKQHWRGLYRLVGSLLLLFGIVVSYWWFHKLAPLRRTLSMEWFASHSKEEYWRETKKGAYRGIWFRDAGSLGGRFGDKSWAEWIMKRTKPGTTMGGMGSLCHSATSMRFISNQDMGDGADAWLVWWEKNKSKSQEQWIAEGFTQHGIKVDVPPKAEQAPLLLAVLGNSETNEAIGIPAAVKYNAFRCLRDTGFAPVEFVLSNQTVSVEVKRGLQAYAEFERKYPAIMGLGILPFARLKDGWWKDFRSPLILTIPVQIVAYTLALGPILLGVGIIVWSRQRKQGGVEPATPPHSEPATRSPQG